MSSARTAYLLWSLYTIMATRSLMDEPGWYNLPQFVTEPSHSSFAPGKLVAAQTRGAPTPLATPQIPTPPDSHASADSPGARGDNLVSISTTFFPGATLDAAPADAIFLSNDNVWFYVDTAKLLQCSANNFNKSLVPINGHANDPFGRIVSVPESSIVLNIVLHAIYDISCAKYSPPFDAITAAISALTTYGVPVRPRISPGTPLFSLLMTFAPLVPLELYILAASYDLYDLAAFASQYLHSLSLSSLTDEMGIQMGAVYLKRLFSMHYGRVDALRRILLTPPLPHAPAPQCDSVDQKKLTRAWALASASLVWDARADIPASSIASALSPLADDLTCDLCRTTLKDRIKTLVVEWSNIKRTI